MKPPPSQVPLLLQTWSVRADVTFEHVIGAFELEAVYPRYVLLEVLRLFARQDKVGASLSFVFNKLSLICTLDPRPLTASSYSILRLFWCFVFTVQSSVSRLVTLLVLFLGCYFLCLSLLLLLVPNQYSFFDNHIDPERH